MGGRVGGSEKNEINAILNSVEVKVEVGVELGKSLMRIVATTSLPAVDSLNADRWNATRSCQKLILFNVCYISLDLTFNKN